MYKNDFFQRIVYKLKVKIFPELK